MSTTSTQENKIQIQNYIDVIPSKFFVALISLLSLGVFKYYKEGLQILPKEINEMNPKPTLRQAHIYMRENLPKYVGKNSLPFALKSSLFLTVYFGLELGLTLYRDKKSPENSFLAGATLGTLCGPFMGNIKKGIPFGFIFGGIFGLASGMLDTCGDYFLGEDYIKKKQQEQAAANSNVIPEKTSKTLELLQRKSQQDDLIIELIEKKKENESKS